MGCHKAGAPHGSDYNFLSDDVFPEGPVSDKDTVLVERMAGAFIRLAYTGSPSSPDGEAFAVA